MAVSTRPARGPRAAVRQESRRGRAWWHYAILVCGLLVLAGLLRGGYAAWFALTYVRASYARVTGLVVNVAAKSDTRVQQVLVRTGDEVSDGQVVATLDQADLEAEVERAEATLEARKVELARSERELALTINETAASIEEAEAQLAAAGARLRQAEAEMKMEAEQQPDEVRQAEADLAAAKSRLEDVQVRRRRAEKLHAEGAVSEQSLDAARIEEQTAEAAVESAAAALEVARARDYRSQIQQQAVATRQAEELQARAGVRSAETRGRRVDLLEQQVLARRAAVSEAEAELAAARVRLSDAALRSPITGVVVRGPGHSVKDGEVVVKGQPVVTLLATDVPFWISASVSELYAARVREGQPVLVKIESLNRAWLRTRWLHGQVEKVGAATEFQVAEGSSPWMVQQIPLKITFDPEGLPVKHGATCRVWIDARQ